MYWYSDGMYSWKNGWSDLHNKDSIAIYIVSYLEPQYSIYSQFGKIILILWQDFRRQGGFGNVSEVLAKNSGVLANWCESDERIIGLCQVRLCDKCQIFALPRLLPTCDPAC